MIISGALNGTPFACADGATSCSVPLAVDEGTGTVSFAVNSATGLSAGASSNYSVDVTTPQVDGSVSGALGSNGWYVSEVTLTASASDSTSGIDSLQTNTDSARWISYTDPFILSDGVHNVDIQAYDVAGNSADASVTVRLEEPITRTHLPGRMKELMELYDAGYQLVFDDVTNSYILTKP